MSSLNGYRKRLEARLKGRCGFDVAGDPFRKRPADRWEAAATTLLKMMVDPDVPPSCRIRAADSVLGHAAKAIELEEIEARLAALEEAAQKDGKR